MDNKRLYFLYAINDRSGTETPLHPDPLTHAECMTLKSRFSDYPGIRRMVKEATTGVFTKVNPS